MRILRLIFLVPLFVIVAYVALWGSLALWFKLPGPHPLVIASALGFGLCGLGTLVSFFYSTLWRWLSLFAAVLAALLVWWNTLEPPVYEDWAAEVARQTTGTIEGDTLTLTDVRDFTWRSETDFDEAWVTRSYDLGQLESVDLFMSYWAGPQMAHLMLSFGFADGDYLAWTVEVKRAAGGEFSPVADFFKANSLAVIAGTERDVVGLRSNTQTAEVYLSRLRSDPERRRELLESYVRAGNGLVDEPQFFHSLLTNCSRTVINLARSVGAPIPADWRVLVNGYFPSYLYDLGALNTDFSFEELKATGYISERARAQGLNDGYSGAVREGVAGPE